jgi:small-conductance mechanosensitive channel
VQDTLANLFSGIWLVASKQIRAGDYVRLSNGKEGYVNA